MLTKLLRYEFKSTGRVVLPIAAGVLVLNIFTNILSHFVQNTSDRLPLAGVAMALLALASAVSLLVVLAICAFIEIQQFYRLLGERGYLMLALPVPIWQHIAAKVICGTVWTLFGMVFFTLCGMLTTDTVSGGSFASDFSRVTAEDVAIWSAMLLIILALIAGALLHAYLACAFAAQFTQQRLLISIAAYFVIGFIGQMAALVTAVFVAFHGYKYLNNTSFSAASFFGPDNTLGVIVLTLLALGRYRAHPARRLCADCPCRCPAVGTDPVAHDEAAESGVILLEKHKARRFIRIPEKRRASFIL